MSEARSSLGDAQERSASESDHAVRLNALIERLRSARSADAEPVPPPAEPAAAQPHASFAPEIRAEAASIDLAPEVEPQPRALPGRAPGVQAEPANSGPVSPGLGARFGAALRNRLGTTRPDAEKQPRLTAKERRWERRRRRYVFEEILGWVLVPIILVAAYWFVVWALSLFGLTIASVIEGVQMLLQAVM